MLAALTLAVLAATPAGPLAPRGAELAFLVRAPREGLPALQAFLDEAGGYAPTLRPQHLGPALGAMLGADLFDVASLEGAGVDVDAPLTLFQAKGATLLCFQTKGAAALERLRASVAMGGPAKTKKVEGAKLTGTAVGRGWRQGFAQRGRAVCTANDTLDVLPALELAAEALAGSTLGKTKEYARATAGLDTSLLLYVPADGSSSAISFSPSRQGLEAKGRVLTAQPVLDKPAEGDPFAKLELAAPFTATARFARSALRASNGPLARALQPVLSEACPRCEPGVAAELLAALEPTLFGSAAAVATRLDPTAPRGRLIAYLLVPNAIAFSLQDPEGARKALSDAARRLETGGAAIAAAKPSSESAGWTLTLGAGRPVWVGISGRALYLANDAGARDGLLKALAEAAPGTAPHAARVALDGPRTAGALRRISILDLGRSPEVAALFALGVEAGPLLHAAGPVTGFADPEPGSVRFEAGFRFKAR